MAVIEGQIEPLKKLKVILDQNGITRFTSVAEINHFVKNYETERNGIPEVVKDELDREIRRMQLDLAKHQQDYDVLRNEAVDDINLRVAELERGLQLVREKSNKSLIHKIFCYPKTKFLIRKRLNLEKNFEVIVNRRTNFVEGVVSQIKNKLDDYEVNRDTVISERCLRL